MRVRRNYVWCLAIVFIFIGLAEAKMWGGREILKSSYGRSMPQNGRTNFHRQVDPSRHHVLEKLGLNSETLACKIVTICRKLTFRSIQYKFSVRDIFTEKFLFDAMS